MWRESEDVDLPEFAEFEDFCCKMALITITKENSMSAFLR
jgi:hypothetical protein